jgi:hypothetical protein
MSYLCLCPDNFNEDNCSILDQNCAAGFCPSDALCKPNYQGLLNENQQPYCVCPLGRFGRRCELVHDQCNSNPCQNQGVCLPSDKWNQYYCKCIHPYLGKHCELSKQAVILHINQSNDYRAMVVQYFEINFVTLDLILLHQNVFTRLPGVLHFLHDKTNEPEMIVAKQYSAPKPEIYIIVLQVNVTSINITTQMNEINRCINTRLFFPTDEGTSDIYFIRYMIVTFFA